MLIFYNNRRDVANTRTPRTELIAKIMNPITLETNRLIIKRTNLLEMFIFNENSNTNILGTNYFDPKLTPIF